MLLFIQIVVNIDKHTSITTQIYIYIKYSRNYLIMNRCEHGEVISHFCISQYCKWKQVGGCNRCLTKYHNTQQCEIITHEKLQKLSQKLMLNPQIRIKYHPLRQAIYNYFMILKGQISSSLDDVCRALLNNLGNPVLSINGHLQAFKKIKNRQFKKLTKQQLSKYYQFVKQAKKSDLQDEEKYLYYQEVDIITKVVPGINQCFGKYGSIVQDSSSISQTFGGQKQFYDKILTITSSIQQTNNNKYKKNKQQKQSQLITINNQIKQQIQQINNINKQFNQQLNKQSNNNNQICISIKNQLNSQFNSSTYKQQQINQDNIPYIPMKISKMGKAINFNTQQQQYKSPNLVLLNDTEQNNYIQQNNKFLSITQINKDKPRLKKRKKRFSQELTDLNIGQFYQQTRKAHKQLPRQPSTQKLYDNAKNVRGLKVKIPVSKNVYKQDQQNPQKDQQLQSPIYQNMNKIKLKESIKTGLVKLQSIKQTEQNQLLETAEQRKSKISKISSNHNFDQVEQFTVESQQQLSQQELMISQAQANSLALLMQSLPMKIQQAIPLLQSSIKYSHNNLSAAQYLSYLYIMKKKPKQCLDLCNKFLQQLQGSQNQQQLSIHISNNKAVALNKLGRSSQAISILQRCILYKQEDIYYKNLGDAYFQLGIFQKAIYNYNKAIVMNDQFDEAIYNLAVCQFMLNNMDDALTTVNMALKLVPENDDYESLLKEITIMIDG